MTVTESLARAALAPRDRETDQYLKVLTLTNLAAGISPFFQAMFAYLRTEVGDAVPAGTLREFCEGSAAISKSTIIWRDLPP